MLESIMHQVCSHAWVFDMDHKSENIRIQLFQSPVLLIIDNIQYLLSVSLCMRAYVTANKIQHQTWNFPFAFITEIIVSYVEMALFIKAARLYPRWPNSGSWRILICNAEIMRETWTNKHTRWWESKLDKKLVWSEVRAGVTVPVEMW